MEDTAGLYCCLSRAKGTLYCSAIEPTASHTLKILFIYMHIYAIAGIY